MQSETFQHQPLPKVHPAIVTTDINTHSLPDDVFSSFGDLMVSLGNLTIEHLAMQRFLKKRGEWEDFKKYFQWEWEPE